MDKILGDQARTRRLLALICLPLLIFGATVVACVLALGASKGHTGVHHLRVYGTWIALIGGGWVLTFVTGRIPSRWRARARVKG